MNITSVSTQLTILSLTNCRSEVATSIVLLCKQAGRGKSCKEWLPALPLFHFLKEFSKPFGKLVQELNPQRKPFLAHRELYPDDLDLRTYDSEEGYVQKLV